jgi:hypothetical protein
LDREKKLTKQNEQEKSAGYNERGPTVSSQFGADISWHQRHPKYLYSFRPQTEQRPELKKHLRVYQNATSDETKTPNILIHLPTISLQQS